MLKELEIELKTTLSQIQFEHICKLFFTDQKPLIQTNTYFDSSDSLLKMNSMALRSRTTSNQKVLTLKVKRDTLTSFEYTVPFSTNLKTTLSSSPELQQHLPCNADKLNPIVTFTTHRYTHELSFGILCLDCTYFENGNLDFELEIEIQTETDFLEASEWIQSQNINYQQAPTKIARAIAQQSL
ncbi:MAG: CYTH domain-containing protein [Culicoidibacterales bacterium]